MKRKKRIVLAVGAAIIALSLIGMTIMLALTFSRVEYNGAKYASLFFFLLVCPIVSEEICLLMGVYQFDEQKTKRRFLASAGVVLFAAALQFSVLIYELHYFNPQVWKEASPEEIDFYSRFAEYLLITGWPLTLLLSWVQTVWRKKKKQRNE